MSPGRHLSVPRGIQALLQTIWSPERFGPLCAKGHLMHLLLQCVSSNGSYLLLSGQNEQCPHAGSPSVGITAALPVVLVPPGLVWSRYSLVITPKNWNLFCVNFFLGIAGSSQLYRIWRFVPFLKQNVIAVNSPVGVSSLSLIGYNERVMSECIP